MTDRYDMRCAATPVNRVDPLYSDRPFKVLLSTLTSPSPPLPCSPLLQVKFMRLRKEAKRKGEQSRAEQSRAALPVYSMYCCTHRIDRHRPVLSTKIFWINLSHLHPCADHPPSPYSMLHAAPRRGSANDKDSKERDKEKEKDREAVVEVEGDAEGEGADDGVEVFVADEAVDFGGLKQVCVCISVCLCAYTLQC
jgi:hypothetical protein